MAILSLLARLGLDKSGFDAGMSAATKSVSSFGKQVAGSFGAAAVAAGVAALTRSAINYADEMQELSERLSTSTKGAQEWSLAAQLNGKDAEFVASNFQKMEKALNEANLGNKDSVRSLQALGITMAEIRSIGVDEAMRKAADAINGSGNEAGKSAAMLDLFGKSATKMKVVFQDLGTANKLSGLFPTDAEVNNVKQAADATDVFFNLLKGYVVQKISPGSILRTMFGTVMPVLNALQLPGMKQSVGGMLGDKINETIAGMNKAGDDASASREAFLRMQRMQSMAEQISKVQEQIDDKGLSNEEKRVRLTEQRAAIMDRLRDIEAPGPQSQELRQQAILELLQNERDIVNLPENETAAKKAAARAAFHGPEGTRLGSIGGSLGAASNRGEQMASEALRVQKEVRDVLRGSGIVVRAWR
jgi:hypothetical protein